MNPILQLRPLDGPEAIARAAASEWLGLLKRRPNRAQPFGVALSGGRIAKLFYEAVTAAVEPAKQDFANVHFFWADERCVPPSDPENNYSIAKGALFDPLRIPAENIHRIRAEIASDYAVQEAEAEICRVLPLSANGQPQLDLLILGMGEDGHVASLFPEEDPRLEFDPRVYRRVHATKPPPERITLGYQPIIGAKEALVLASGPSKRDALARLKQGDRALPITRVVLARERTIVWHDA